MAKKKKNGFSKMLKENQKRIIVDVKGEERTVEEMTEESINNLTMCPVDSMIPVGVSEAAENSIPGESQLTLITSYAQSVFSMHEFALKNKDVKQTLIMHVPAADLQDLLEYDICDENFSALLGRTNLKLTLDGVPEKRKTKMFRWVEEKGNDVYVMKIPELLFFYGDIKKNATSKAKIFDLILVIVRTDRSLTKMRKKDKEMFEEVSTWIVEKTYKILSDMGVGCVHLTLNNELFDDPHDYATSWIKIMKPEENKILNRCIFCTSDPDTLIQFHHQLITDAMNHPIIKVV